MNSRLFVRRACAVALALASTYASAQAQPTYSINFYAISTGAMTLTNRCFRLSGAIGEPAPGYSSDLVYSLYAGFWATAIARGADEIFFAGFEEC